MTSTAASRFFERRRARLASQRVDHEDEEATEETNDSLVETESAVNENATANNSNNNNSNNSHSSTPEDEPEAASDENPLVVNPGTDDSAPNTNSMTLAELEEERELTRRRSSACVMFAVFVLFRLWIEAIQDGDFGLLMICLVGTSWTARWVRHNREREEELDRRIANYVENQGNTVDRNDLRMLSFQAQLALAIMESQRQMMMNGGYGNDDANQTPGVTEEAKKRWKHFEFRMDEVEKKSKSSKSGYGSVSQEDESVAKPGKSLALQDEEPHCSICLCEYEDKETLVRLPCSHFYHEGCINSWTSNHVKCPLCNYDLETAAPATDGSIV